MNKFGIPRNSQKILFENKVSNSINILIIDDHPMTVDSYVSLLTSVNKKNEIIFHTANDGQESFFLLKKLEITKSALDIAFIDINLPPYEEEKILSGVDVAKMVRNLFPKCKVIIISMHKEPVWVNRIFKGINPEGFISKNEINHKLFLDVFARILNKEYYFSPSVMEAQRFFIQKNIKWDEHDSKILQLISEGKKTINLPKYIPLSLSSIEKRKANIKKQLVFDTGSTKELIEIAKKIGLL